MIQCTVCGKKSVTYSGSHEYCSNCNFIRFTVTNDYLEAAKVLLGSLVSNTSFEDDNVYSASVGNMIEMHLPRLNDYIVSIVNGQMEFLQGIANDVKQHAINLQIGPQPYGAEEWSGNLVCACGSENFVPHKELLSQIECTSCKAVFHYKEDTGRFMPAFICSSCGYNACEDDGLIAVCKECHTGHWLANGEPL